MDREHLLLQAPHKVLVTHAVLLLRTVNRHESKETQMNRYEKYLSSDQLVDYILHFHDEVDGLCDDVEEGDGYGEDRYYTPSVTSGDYGPGNPWDALGMSIWNFI